MALLSLVTMAMGLASCSSSDDDKEQEPEVAAPQMLTFGFSASDNAGVLSKDCQATVGTDGKIEVVMPATVDKKSLVAQFTVNAGNKVTVAGVAQESGKTKNDFSVPVDYIVSNANGTQNVKYTVTVTKQSDQQWSELDVFADTVSYSGMTMKVNPVDNVPYVAFKERNGQDKMWVMKLDNNHWTTVGGTGWSAPVSGSEYAFDFDAAGTPWVAFSDNSGSGSNLKASVSVMKFADGKWNFVGEQAFSNTQAKYVALAALDGNKALVSSVNNSKSSPVVGRYGFVVSDYNGTAWSTAEHPNLTGKNLYACCMANDNKAAYLLTIMRGEVDGVKYGHSVFKYENGAWTALRSNYTHPGASQTSIVCYGMTVSFDGQLYITTGDDADNTGSYGVRLETYSNNEWTTCGGNILPLGFSITTHSQVRVAIAPDGTPYVIYIDESDNSYAKVIRLDSETKQWTSAVALGSEAAQDVNIAFTSTGIGYASYLDKANHLHTFVLK